MTDNFVLPTQNTKMSYFFDWQWVFKQKEPTESILKMVDVKIQFEGVDQFLESPFDE